MKNNEKCYKINKMKKYKNLNFSYTGVPLGYKSKYIDGYYSIYIWSISLSEIKNIIDYYKNPVIDNRFKNRATQYRLDTRINCYNCNTFFIPSLIISDGSPKNEVQLLCRVQTIDAIESHYLVNNIKVLSKKPDNVVYSKNMKGIKNDVFIKDLEKKPTLITNMIQYTPFNLILNLLDGTNIEKGDLLFNEWNIMG